MPKYPAEPTIGLPPKGLLKELENIFSALMLTNLSTDKDREHFKLLVRLKGILRDIGICPVQGKVIGSLAWRCNNVEKSRKNERAVENNKRR